MLCIEVERNNNKRNGRYWVYRTYAWLMYEEVKAMYGAHCDFTIKNARTEVSSDLVKYYYVQIAIH